MVLEFGVSNLENSVGCFGISIFLSYFLENRGFSNRVLLILRV